jgi:hypothetical protein
MPFKVTDASTPTSFYGPGYARQVAGELMKNPKKTITPKDAGGVLGHATVDSFEPSPKDLLAMNKARQSPSSQEIGRVEGAEVFHLSGTGNADGEERWIVQADGQKPLGVHLHDIQPAPGFMW